jgi:hypothetical protein
MLARAPIRVDAPNWFPDWSGEACAIVAPGPSVKGLKLDRLRGKVRCIAIKECAVDLCPWADVAYGCDAAWWMHRRGLPEFKGLKVAWESSVFTSFPDVHLISIQETARSRPGDRQYIDQILVDVPGVVGSGRNSGFQALNLAVQFGVTQIILIGFDLHGSHYYGRNNWFKAGNPDEYQFDRCRRAFSANAPILKSLGVDVVNASPTSTITCFRQISIERATMEWAL